MVWTDYIGMEQADIQESVCIKTQYPTMSCQPGDSLPNAAAICRRTFISCLRSGSHSRSDGRCSRGPSRNRERVAAHARYARGRHAPCSTTQTEGSLVNVNYLYYLLRSTLQKLLTFFMLPSSSSALCISKLL
jgi:hypothetical protein